LIDHGHTHHDGSSAVTASMMLVILAVVTALILLGVVFAWNPWAGGDSTGPGQGGEDSEPVQEQQVPNLQR
jgi:hypothetical protein